MSKLAHALRLWRVTNDMSMQKAADQIGVSKATYCRFEQGKGMDADSFLKLIDWMMKP